MVDKERILDALDDFKDEYGTSFSSAYAEETDIIEDALNLYYEMLKEEKKKRKEDAISREIYRVRCQMKKTTKEFCDEIKELPSVVHTQKTGRWIFVDNAHEHARCSECDYGNVDLFDGKPHNYCPNCGSFMMDNERTLEYADQDIMMSAT